MKPISTKNNTLPDKIYLTVEKELKLFYFSAFRRRPKNLLTLELIKECYSDQINFFLNQISKITTLGSPINAAIIPTFF